MSYLKMSSRSVAVPKYSLHTQTGAIWWRLSAEKTKDEIESQNDDSETEEAVADFDAEDEAEDEYKCLNDYIEFVG